MDAFNTHTLIAFSLFALVTSITPGPNNLMILASGINFGFKASIPHMLGINSGFLLLVLAVGVGLERIVLQLPWIFDALKWGGAIYLLYLAWCIATSGPVEDASRNARPAKPMKFLSAAIFQWVNPKAWVMAMGVFSTYIPASNGLAVIVTAAMIFALINLPCVGVWTLFGSGLRRLFQSRKNLIAFNYGMAALLVLSLYPLLSVF